MCNKLKMVFLTLMFMLVLTAASVVAASPKPILLEGAMEEETQYLENQLTEPEDGKIGPYHYKKGLYEGIPVIVLRTEVAGCNAAAATALAIEKFQPAAVINQGTAGGYDPSLHRRDIVVGVKTIAGDAWASQYAPRGQGVDYRAIRFEGAYAKEPGEEQFVRKVFYDADKELLEAAGKAIPFYTDSKVVMGNILTTDEWNNQVDRVFYLHEKLGASCEEMEANAVAVVCTNYEVPFLAIRVISNSCLHKETFDLSTSENCQKYVLQVVEIYGAENDKA